MLSGRPRLRRIPDSLLRDTSCAVKSPIERHQTGEAKHKTLERMVYISVWCNRLLCSMDTKKHELRHSSTWCDHDIGQQQKQK